MTAKNSRVQNTTKKQNKRQNCTHMSAAELIRLREEMRLQPVHMYRNVLNIPRRTYQDYETGRRSIPEDIATRIREAHRKDREFMTNLPGRIHASLDNEYPGGMIPSHDV